VKFGRSAHRAPHRDDAAASRDSSLATFLFPRRSSASWFGARAACPSVLLFRCNFRLGKNVAAIAAVLKLHPAFLRVIAKSANARLGDPTALAGLINWSAARWRRRNEASTLWPSCLWGICWRTPICLVSTDQLCSTVTSNAFNLGLRLPFRRGGPTKFRVPRPPGINVMDHSAADHKPECPLRMISWRPLGFRKTNHRLSPRM